MSLTTAILDRTRTLWHANADGKHSTSGTIRRLNDRVAELEGQLANRDGRLADADTLIRKVLQEKSDTYLDLRNAEQARDCAQAAASVKDIQIRELNARIRDLEEQRGQAPAAPLVTAARFDNGPVLRAGKRPVPEWASGETDAETTQSIPLAQLPRPAA